MAHNNTRILQKKKTMHKYTRNTGSGYTKKQRSKLMPSQNHRIILKSPQAFTLHSSFTNFILWCSGNCTLGILLHMLKYCLLTVFQHITDIFIKYFTKQFHIVVLHASSFLRQLEKCRYLALMACHSPDGKPHYKIKDTLRQLKF